MIYAVAIGLLILVGIFILFTSNKTKPKSKEELFADAKAYFIKNEAILDVKVDPGRNQLIVIYNSSIKDDYYSMAKYAGKNLLKDLGKEEVTIILARDKPENHAYRFSFSNGKLLDEIKY